MGKKIRGVKLKGKDINKNAGRDISHVINKIKSNERKYTIILVSIFMFMFIFAGYFSLKYVPDGDNYNFDYYDSDNVSISGQVVTLTSDDCVNDVDGLKSDAKVVNIYNGTSQNVNYKLIYKEDTDMREVCKCNESGFDLHNIKFSLDGKTVERFNEDEMIITTGMVKPRDKDIVNVRMWVDENCLNSGHFHGKFVLEEIEG